MIISTHLNIKVSSSNASYWRNLGYSFPPVGGKAAKNGTHVISVSVSHLLPGSNAKVTCKCDKCKETYVQRFCRDTEVCYACRKREYMFGNSYGKANLGKKLESIRGENHPRWNPDKSEFARYANRVRGISEAQYKKHKSVINPMNHPRTRCGVKDGWQLDHRVSVKRGFLEGIDPEIIGDVSNLQMLPWKDNRDKW